MHHTQNHHQAQTPISRSRKHNFHTTLGGLQEHHESNASSSQLDTQKQSLFMLGSEDWGMDNLGEDGDLFLDDDSGNE